MSLDELERDYPGITAFVKRVNADAPPINEKARRLWAAAFRQHLINKSNNTNKNNKESE